MTDEETVANPCYDLCCSCEQWAINAGQVDDFQSTILSERARACPVGSFLMHCLAKLFTSQKHSLLMPSLNLFSGVVPVE